MRKGWTIDPVHWEQLATLLGTRANWTSVILTTTASSMVPNRSGVYAICVRPPIATSPTHAAFFSELATPIYIGRSKSNIRDRFLKHCRSADLDLYGAKLCYSESILRFWFIELPRDHVHNVEAALIDCFGPSVNRRSETIEAQILPPVDA